MPAFAVQLTPRRLRRAPVICSTSSSGAPAAAQQRVRRGVLCAAALKALRDTYTACNSLPQTGGCAHALGRVAESARTDALESLASVGGGSAERAALHDSAAYAAVAALGRVGGRKGDEIVLALNDDPTLTAPMRAAATARGMTVRWVSGSDFRDIAPAVSARTRLLALQLVSPLLGNVMSSADDNGMLAALRFARSAGVSVLLDVTHALAAAPVRASELPADVVVLAGDAIRAHPGAAISLWHAKAWERFEVDSVDRCVSGDSSTAAAAALAAAMSEKTVSSLYAPNAELAAALCEELEELGGVRILGESESARDIPAAAISIPDSSSSSKARHVARNLWEALPDDAATARLRVIPSFGEGRGKRKVERPELLCFEFSAMLHSVADVRQLVRAIGQAVKD